MRRTPDKETIAELQADGLTVRQIANLYGVTPQSVYWAIKFESQEPKETIALPGPVPLHVVRHWRYIWHWPEDKIRQYVDQYTRSWQVERKRRSGVQKASRNEAR